MTSQNQTDKAVYLSFSLQHMHAFAKVFGCSNKAIVKRILEWLPIVFPTDLLYPKAHWQWLFQINQKKTKIRKRLFSYLFCDLSLSTIFFEIWGGKPITTAPLIIYNLSTHLKKYLFSTASLYF
jgi:hypothetical protein